MTLTDAWRRLCRRLVAARGPMPRDLCRYTGPRRGRGEDRQLLPGALVRVDRRGRTTALVVDRRGKQYRVLVADLASAWPAVAALPGEDDRPDGAAPWRESGAA